MSTILCFTLLEEAYIPENEIVDIQDKLKKEKSGYKRIRKSHRSTSYFLGFRLSNNEYNGTNDRFP